MVKVLILYFSYLILLLELFCFLLPLASKGHFVFLGHLTRPPNIDYLSYDYELGWNDYEPRNQNVKNPKILFVGDSFTYGDEVEEKQTWPYYLSQILSIDIKNTAVRAYGPDQVLLKLKKEVIPDSVKYIVQGLISSDFFRLKMVYFPFHSHLSQLYLTKPRFLVNDSGQIELYHNPLQTSEDISKLSHQDFLKEIGVHDFWYQNFPLPPNQFPYMQMLLHKSFWWQVGNAFGYPCEDLMQKYREDTEALILLEYVLDGFFKEVRSKNKVPILVYLPVYEEIRDFRLNPSLQSFEQKLVQRYCMRKKTTCFFPLLEDKKIQQVDLENSFAPYKHYSTSMNQIIAQYMAKKLKELDKNPHQK